MNTPLTNWRMGKRGLQVGGFVLILIGFWWLFGDTLAIYVSPQRGLITREATVISLDQRGTFQEPAFSVTLSYDVEDESGTMTTIRSGQRVEYSTYARLSLDDVVMIRFDPIAPHEWTLLALPEDNLFTHKMIPAAALMIGGLLLMLLPWLLRVGSRAGDFERNDGEHLQIS